MDAIRFSLLKSGCSSMKPSWGIARVKDLIDIGVSLPLTKRNHCTKEFGYENNSFGMMGLVSLSGSQGNRTNLIGSFSSNPCLRSNISPAAISPVLNYRLYSSFFGGSGDKVRYSEVPSASGGGGEPAVSESGSGGTDLVDMAKDAWKSTVDAVSYVGEKAKDASTEFTPRVEGLLEAHPYLRDIIVPVGSTLTGTVLAWVVLPRILRRLHKYSTQGPAALLSGTALWGPVPYEKSFWGALEDPLRYLVTFVAFSQIAVMVAPTTVASKYIGPAWNGAVIVSFVWCLHRWKSNVIARSLEARSIGIDREKLLTLDKISSVGLFVLGAMASAEAFGVAVQSILTVGGIGGVATAFAARDILGNILSGLSVQLSQPFSIGDTIKAGSVEGQVVEMGLTTTSLLSAEKFPIIVPNSMFSSQVIVNKSRARWRAKITKIPFHTEDVGKIPPISEDIKAMLKSNPKVFLEKEPPYCFLSRIESSNAELTLGYNLRQMSKDEMYSTEQDILLKSVQIIKKHGARLGGAMD